MLLLSLLLILLYCQQFKGDAGKISLTETEKQDLDAEKEELEKDTGTTLPDPEIDENDLLPEDREDLNAQNRSPRISSVLFAAEDMTEYLRNETLPMQYVEELHSSIIIAEDEDGDVLSFDISCTHGVIEELEVLSSQSVFFVWRSPGNTESSLDPLNVRIAIRVSDGNSGQDLFPIRIALLPVTAEEDPPLEEIIIAGTVIPADISMSGYIIEGVGVRTGDIYVGDWDNNEQVKGYITFDIREMRNWPASSIRAVWIDFELIGKLGNPETISERRDFKIFEYGESLEMEHFRVGGRRLFYGTASGFDPSRVLTSPVLLEELTAAIERNQSFFQIKIGMERKSNLDNNFDIFFIHPSHCALYIEYESIEV